MRVYFYILASVLWASVGIGETNSVPKQVESWGVNTNGVEVSCGVTNQDVSPGAIAYFSFSLHNGSQIPVSIIRNQSEVIVPFIRAEMVDAAGKHFKIFPKEDVVNIWVPPIVIQPRVTTNWNVDLEMASFEGNGNFHDLPAGNYTFKAILEFRVKDKATEAASNSLNLRVK